MDSNRTPRRGDDLRRFVSTPAEYLHYKRQHGRRYRESHTEKESEQEICDGFIHYLFPDWLEYVGRSKPPT